MNAIALKNEIPEESGKSGITAWSRLEEIGVPVTVACGDLDLPFVDRPLQGARRLAAADRGSRCSTEWRTFPISNSRRLWRS